VNGAPLLQTTVPLAPLSTLGVGGPAAWFQRVRRADEIATAHEWADAQGIPIFVLGGGSNLVIADEGFRGLVVRIELEGHAFDAEADGALLRAAAGEPWDTVVAASVERGLAGLECLSGIPGSVGGTPIQNVGAYGQEVAETIDRVEAFDRTTRSLQTLSAADCRFSYRMSRFKRDEPDRFVITSVSFRLRPGLPSTTYPDVVRYLREAGITDPTVTDVRAAVIAVRRKKGMVIDAGDPDSRSVGSFFMNPLVTDAEREELSRRAGEPSPGFAVAGGVKVPAAWLIERAGFIRGFADGPVAISGKHPLALVNRGGAAAADILRLATTIKRRVLDRFGIALRTEPVFVGFDGNDTVEYLQHG
jgi:UDP-N-acetylmuramate dehydrogenase